MFRSPQILKITTALGLALAASAASAQTADLRVLPPDYDFARLCRQEEKLVSDPVGLAGWQGGALDVAEDRLLDIAALYRDGSPEVAADAALAKRLFAHIVETGSGRASNRAKYQLAKLILDDETAAPADERHAAGLLREAAATGDGSAAVALATLYEEGRGVAQDYQEAARYYRIAAVEEKPDAAFALSRLYAEGLVPAPSDEAAQQMAALGLIELLGQANQGKCNALIGIAWTYDRGTVIQQDPEIASAWYLASARSGDTRAMTEIAARYSGGIGIGQSMPDAIEWYSKAAAAGSPEAAFEVGRIYAEGEGIEADAGRALSWLERAASMGSIKSMQRLGEFYAGELAAQPEDGIDRKKSLEWYETAHQRDPARLGVLHALADAYLEGGDIPRDPKLAAHYQELAIENGSITAIRDLADLYLAGDGVSQDDGRALSLFRQAAGRGDPDSHTQLSEMFRCGIGTGQDLSQADRWLDRAASQGVPSAMLELAERRLATGSAADLAERRLLLLRAAVGGSRKAMVTLAESYEAGIGIAPDPANAARWRANAIMPGDAEDQAKGLLALADAIMGDGPLAGTPVEAAVLYQQAADLGNPRAKLELGRLQRILPGEDATVEKGLALIRAAMEAENATAPRALARLALEKGDRQEAVALFDKAIALGDTLARIDKAELFFDEGRGDPEDLAMARQLLDEAIAAHPCSVSEALSVAEAYAKGIGGDENRGKAFDWIDFVRQAFPADTYTLVRLGRTAMDAARSEAEREMAEELLTRAADLGSSEAMYRLSRFYEPDGDYAGDPEKQALWRDRSADAGHPDSLYKRALARASGLEGAPDYQAALADLKQAVELGNEGAMRHLAKWYLSGLAGEQDQTRAVELLNRAAAFGDAGAMLELANLSIVGIGMPVDPSGAVDWLKRAAKQGNGEAMHRLSVLYATGYGVAPDAERAEYWIGEAVSVGYLDPQVMVGQ